MKHLFLAAAMLAVASADPVPVVFDTDMGNDVDDVMALAMLHSLQTRGHCNLLAVTVTKDHSLAAPFVDAVNTFFGRPDLPIGMVRNGATRDEGKFNRLASEQSADGKPRYPHDLARSEDAPEAVELLRKTLAGQADGAVVIVQVGFFTNLARLLDSKPDAISPLGGEELVRTKVKLLVLMAGAFQTIDGGNRYIEYNVIQDLSAAQALAKRWPTPRVWSGFEIGIAATFPHRRIERDFGYVAHHPLKDAYILYQPPPHDRPTWDPTAVLYGVLPEHGYFRLSPPGNVTVEADGATAFRQAGNGRDRYLILDSADIGRVQEAIVQLSSQPPK
jgi:hypothetical protein